MKKIRNGFVFFFIYFLVMYATGALAADKVIVSTLSGTVGVQMEAFVARVVALAENDKAALVVFRLDTPGGLVDATRGITQSILESKVPVAVWVPRGGRAASAGAFIMQAAHIAAMAGGTNIGAAHPVTAGGDDVPNSDMKKKVMNDLLAQMRTLTQLRKRNEQVAQFMVEESISLTAAEALTDNVIDIIADDLPSLLMAVDGRVISSGQTIRLNADAVIEEIDMNVQEQLIQYLSSPDIAYILLVGGLLAIFYEVITPGGYILGVTGAVMLLMGGIGLKMLPFNWAGIALVGVGVLLMCLELIVGGTGLLSLLGLGALISGGLFLFRAPGGELLNVSIGMIVGMVTTIGLCFTIFAMMITKTLRSAVTTGSQGLVGSLVYVTEDFTAIDETSFTFGMVKCKGELWRAKAEGPLSGGGEATVVSVDGLTLTIKKGTSL
ncbi:serine protease [Synergistales bacterium]|nr:serine protease [Synergistales bacterium]